MRPCRFAGPASGTAVCPPKTGSTTDTTSPTANTSGSFVRICASVTTCPLGPISSPAACASAELGFTPTHSATTSAVQDRPSWTVVVTPPPAAGANADTAAPSSTTIPASRSSSASSELISSSIVGSSCRPISSSVTASPRCRRLSASSIPTNPPPTTIALFAPASSFFAMRSMSSSVHSGSTSGRSIPGSFSCIGEDPVAITSLS